MGGLTPLRASPRLYSPPKEGVRYPRTGGFPLVAMGATPQGADPKGNPFGGVSGAILPKMAPLVLGLLGFAGEYSWSL